MVFKNKLPGAFIYKMLYNTFVTNLTFT